MMLLKVRVLCFKAFTLLVGWIKVCPHCPIFLTAAEHSSGDPCFSATVADYPLRPAMDHWLGRPLPPPTIYSKKAHLQSKTFLLRY